MKAEPRATLIGLPDLKVGLTGSLDVPVLENHSDRSIIGYVLRIESDTGITGQVVFNVRNVARHPLELAAIVPGASDVFTPGAMREVHRDGSPVKNIKVSVDAVVFLDGSLVGPNSLEHSFDAISAYVDSARDFALRALEDDSLVATTLNSFHSIRTADLAAGTWRDQIGLLNTGNVAEQIDLIQSESGPDAAQEALLRMSRLPQLQKGETK